MGSSESQYKQIHWAFFPFSWGGGGVKEILYIYVQPWIKNSWIITLKYDSTFPFCSLMMSQKNVVSLLNIKCQYFCEILSYARVFVTPDFYSSVHSWVHVDFCARLEFLQGVPEISCSHKWVRQAYRQHWKHTAGWWRGRIKIQSYIQLGGERRSRNREECLCGFVFFITRLFPHATGEKADIVGSSKPG